MRSLLLGLDVSPRRMGWGLVDLVSGEPVACGCEAIDLPQNGWERMIVSAALLRGPLNAMKPDGEVQAAYIEHPISRFPGMAYDEGRAVGMVHAEVQRRWPHAPVEYLKPAEWRVLAGLKGNASKQDVFWAAIDLGVRWNHVEETDDINQDAADALLIAVAGQRRNGENWSRAVERGETGEAA